MGHTSRPVLPPLPPRTSPGRILPGRSCSGAHELMSGHAGLLTGRETFFHVSTSLHFHGATAAMHATQRSASDGFSAGSAFAGSSQKRRQVTCQCGQRVCAAFYEAKTRAKIFLVGRCSARRWAGWTGDAADGRRAIAGTRGGGHTRSRTQGRKVPGTDHLVLLGSVSCCLHFELRSVMPGEAQRTTLTGTRCPDQT